MYWLERLRDRLDDRCIVTECTDSNSGCSVSLGRLSPECLALSCDLPGTPFDRTRVHPDFLVIAAPSCDEAWVALVEMKTGRRHILRAVRQLCEGARAVEQIVPPNLARKIVFRPVLVTDQTLGRQVEEKLRRPENKIGFHNIQPESVRWIVCDAHLADVFPE